MVRQPGGVNWGSLPDLCAFCTSTTYRTVVHQLLSAVGPSTLDLYSRAVDTTITWMKHFGSSWQELTLQLLVQILHMAKEASRSDVQAIRLQPQALLRGLKWLAKTALMDDLQTVLNTFLISSFCRGPGEPRDRKEAMPILFILLVKWEQTIMTADSPDWLRLLLGGFLLAIWSSLRYADLQRTSVTNLSLSTNALRGVCRLTKTTRTGQPFGSRPRWTLHSFTSFRMDWMLVESSPNELTPRACLFNRTISYQF